MPWLSGFQYRKKITLSGSTGAGTNYQVLLKVGESSGSTGAHFHVEGHSALFPSGQNDSGDLRFTSSDGTTLLNFWVEKVEGTSPNRIAHCWVKVSADLGTNQDIYCYYGNSAATNVSDLAGTFIREIDGVAGAWHFDEGSGTTAGDSSGNNNNGTLVNGPTWVDGKFGKALNFDGVNDYIEVPYNSTLNPDEFTVLAWAMVKGNVGTWRSVITSRDIYPSRGYIIYASFDDNWNFWIGDSTTSEWRVIIGPSIVLNEWYFLAAWYKAGEMRFYVNNTLYGPIFYTISKNLQHPLRIGAGRTESTPDYFFNGLIDEVFIINRALTEAEMTDLSNNYGYTTTAYPGKVLVRKYVSPEPAFSSAGAEEVVVSPRIMTPSKFW